MKFIRILFILLVTAFVVLQFFGIDRSNPVFDQQSDLISIEKPPVDIKNILRSSCYDCHSNETIWPWYSYIAPVSWMLEEHVIDGRDKLNFSDWGSYKQEDKVFTIEDMLEEIEDGEMPLPAYLLLHSDAKLSKEQKEKLLNWLRSIQKLDS